ncbi:MAG: SRPBCC family protein [Anaerolineae bacterium]|nr:SRPBCC family protein [Gemmatimonadaceae bacterium]
MPPLRHEPSALAPVTVRQDNERWTLVFTRELQHSPERVWTALTDPAELREWAPFDSDRNLGMTGKAAFTMAGEGADEKLEETVRRAKPPRLLEHTWGGDLLRWELDPIASGTRLTLYHTLSDRTWVPKVAAGWHICLDVADRLMSGHPVGRIVGEAGKQHGWERLNDAYAERLGIASSGSPDEEEQAR